MYDKNNNHYAHVNKQNLKQQAVWLRRHFSCFENECVMFGLMTSKRLPFCSSTWKGKEGKGSLIRLTLDYELLISN